ncbi:tumor necrosis factor receptor superfamily member 1A [Cheilinus undulatus]|uniref:tumor necrosis factor receptor superfamily member 1A n=1 Tax=Cheilinus undulatus TaxID=241271 RepID=UPI001BD1CBF7|nr:tumor necrosis factor receptor superfamily member 1A [Cheilinus undulatus]
MMEGRVHRGRWSCKAPVGTVLLLMCMFIPTLTSLPQPSEEPQCSDQEYLSDNKICCNKCSPGYKLVQSCPARNHRSKCEQCPPKQFMDQMNSFENCRSCRTCKESRNEIEVSPCEIDRNTICRCKDGYYKYKIDSETNECRKCTPCRAKEKEKHTCTSERNTVCECIESYYRVNNRCESCKNCTSECKHLCSAPTLNTKAPGLEEKYLANIIGVVVAVVLVMSGLIIITYIVTRWSTQNKLQKTHTETSQDSQDSVERGLIYKEQHTSNSVEAVPMSLLSEQETSNLPDCVPLEIKIPGLIYTVLDLVPVMQVKQLARSLGVKDSEIEHAELDHRSSREAHYQMLRVWAERGSRVSEGGRGGMVHRSLLQELLDKLREMYLGRAAEELETKYGIQ